MLSSEYVLKVKPARFASRLDVRCKREKVKNDFKVFALSYQKNEVTFYQDREECERHRDADGVEHWKTSVGYITFDVPVRQHDSLNR